MIPRLVSAASLLVLLGCAGSSKDTAPEDSGPPGSSLDDNDHDGFTADEDCDDFDAGNHPGATEVCDSVDNDCDGDVDEGVTLTYYADDDDDGFGDPEDPIESCEAPDDAVPIATDCDDAEASVYPGASEICDGLDNDCDSDIDEGSATPWYRDADEDGYGDPDAEVTACEAPAGYIADDSDCDDGEPTAYPDADEVCDGLDNDCDGDVDEDAVGGTSTWYQDRDEDGYGDPARTVEDCAPPAGYVADGSDCDDLAPKTSPGADELCDDKDNDCDGDIDEAAVDAPAWYADSDGDRYGDPGVGAAACDAPSGYVADDSDCDDDDGDVHPGAAELCNGLDDNCDGDTDEGSAADADPWYSDADGDGFGDAADGGTLACSAPSGSVADHSDCDDGDAAINPDADEVCDGDDNDCDGSTDESSATDASEWYADRDEDGYGDPSRSTRACDVPTGYVADDTDCDDLSDAAYPGGTEVCDDEDNDCNGAVDDGAAGGATWYADADGDHYGDPDSSVEACDAPTGYLSDNTDCDDSSSANHPGATEVCDGDDNDCDGVADEAGAVGTTAYYPDADADGYGDGAATTVSACSPPTGYTADDSDCDDSDADVNPGETETCDGTDNDCDGDEDGVVSFQSSGGSWSDLSAAWAKGTAASPATVTASSTGVYWICPGTYYVSVSASAASTWMSGVYGAEDTVLSGGGTKRVVNATGDVLLDGLTLKDGKATTTTYGANLYVNGSDAVVTDCLFQDGVATRGGNIAVVSGTLSMDTVELDGGEATYGANLYAATATLDLDTVTLSNGDASYGGGMWANVVTLTGTSLIVSDNEASSDGGGFYAGALTATLSDSEFSGNNAGNYGGGVAVLSSSALTATTTQLTGNQASTGGGGLYLSTSSYTFSDTSNIDSNTAGLLGGGAYLNGASTLTCTGTSSTTNGVWGNTALAAGGAYAASSTGKIVSTTCDWTGSSDNSLYDIVMQLYYYNYGNNASFTCTGTTCS